MLVRGAKLAAWLACGALVLAGQGCEDDPPLPVAGQPGIPQAGSTTAADKLGEAAKNAADWTSTAEMQAQLTDERMTQPPYAIRIPVGFEMVPTSPGAPPGVSMAALAGPRRANGSRASLLFLLLTPPSGEKAPTLDRLVDSQVRATNNFHTNVSISQAEVGRIAGLAFARFAWSGDSKQGGFRAQGVTYVAWDGARVVQLLYQARDDDLETRTAAEGAILSLMRQ